ncbi:MAG: FHA domain-containing protein, partial [Planctomycetes bacterium]|nr:FHA domain-containing protein [Planctomycetota bacterium]
MAKLIITEDGRDKIYEIVDDEFSIGSGAQAGLRLRSEEVSPLHVTIRKSREGFRLVDLESKTGTKVNGHAVNEHVLTNGDTIELGDVKIAYIGASGAGAAKRRKPAAAASKGGRKGVKLDAPRPHERGQKNQRSSGANAAIIGAGVLGLILVVWLMLNATNTPKDDIKIEIDNQTDLLNRNSTEALAEAQSVADKWSRKSSSLEPVQRDALEKLQAKLELIQQIDKETKLVEAARPILVRIRNMNRNNSSDVEGIAKMCEQFLKDFPHSPDTAEVQRILAEKKAMGEMTPEQR